MVNNELQEKLENCVKAAIETIVDGGYAPEDVFDEFCNTIDTWSEIKGYKAYCRIFWNTEEDVDQFLDDACDIMNRYDVKAYCNYPSAEYDCCFTVMLYNQIRDE